MQENRSESPRPTAIAPRAAAPSAPPVWCHWHGGHTNTGRVIDIVEQGSGPGANIWACEDCRERYRLVPWAEHPRS